MKPKDVLQKHTAENVGGQGQRGRISLKPGVSAEEIASFEARLPGPVPEEIKELLSFAAGLESEALETSLDFLGNHMFAFEEAFPHGLPLVGDGMGNYWVLDVKPGDGQWGAVFFVSHDPEAVIVQAPNLATFLEQVFDLGADGRPKALRYVEKDALIDVSKKDGGLIDLSTARASGDATLRDLPEAVGEVKVADLRSGQVGSGFAVSEGGQVSRPGTEAVFLISQPPEKKGGLLKSIFGRR